MKYFVTIKILAFLCLCIQLQALPPVEFIAFSVENIDGISYIRWQTSSEINNDHFEIERSNDARTWEMISSIATVGTTNDVQAYEYQDERIKKSGEYYYRLKQIDEDGTWGYTGIKKVSVLIDEIIFYPNPTEDKLNVDISYEGSYIIELYDLQGQLIFVDKVICHAEFHIKQFDTGTYYAIVKQNDKIIAKRYILKY